MNSLNISEIEKNIRIIEAQEEVLQFNFFNSDTALQIGLSLVDKARDEQKAISIDIMKAGQQLFHYAFQNTSPDNDQWIVKKCAVVNRFYKSSLYIALGLKREGLSFEDRYNLNTSDYAPAGGAFPIIIKNTGIIGTITVSGLTQEEDNEMVVWAIKKYLDGVETLDE